MAKWYVNQCVFAVETFPLTQSIVQAEDILGLEFNVLKHERIPTAVHIAAQPSTTNSV
jgi:hypothetical protein